MEPTRELIYFQLTGISDTDIAAEANNVTYTFEIIDNDVPPTNALQVDLSWSLGDGVSINETNFDLLLANNITLDEDDNVASARPDRRRFEHTRFRHRNIPDAVVIAR